MLPPESRNLLSRRAPPCREAETQPVQSFWFILASLSKIIKIDIRYQILDVRFFKSENNVHKNLRNIQNLASSVQHLERNFPHSFQKFLLAKYPAFDLTTPDFSSKINIEHLFEARRIIFVISILSESLIITFLLSRSLLLAIKDGILAESDTVI